MRLKKKKNHRKSVRFFSACFGFHKPYKVFLDGTFIHHLIKYDISPIDKSLSRLLGAPTRNGVLLFTSSCVMAELKGLGSSHAEAFEVAQEIGLARCDMHDRRVAAQKCVLDVIGKNNSEHFFVATQDGELRKKFREIPGVPVIYGLKNALFVDQPSAHQREYVASAEEKRSHMRPSEYQKLHKRKMGRSENHTLDLSSDLDDPANEVVETRSTRNVYTPRQKLGVADTSKFKRKKAKGPNPLSCKPKKKRENSSSAQNQDGDTGGSGTKKKRVRKRKRAHKDGNPEGVSS